MINRLTKWKCLKSFLIDLTSALGTVTIFTAIIDSFFSGYADSLKTTPIRVSVALLCLAYSAIKNWPRSNFPFKFADRDISIEIQIGDILKQKGSIVIPINTDFDMELKGSVVKAKSVQSRVIKEYFQGKTSELFSRIKQELKKDIYKTQRDGAKYKVGTTVAISSDKKPDAPFYFLTNSHKNMDGTRVEARKEDLTLTLLGLWSFVSENGAKGDISIPLLGTGNGRLSMTREEVYKEIVRSFIPSCAGKSYCDKLTICIHPDDIAKFSINIDELIEFTRLHTSYADFSSQSASRLGIPELVK